VYVIVIYSKGELNHPLVSLFFCTDFDILIECYLHLIDILIDILIDCHFFFFSIRLACAFTRAVGLMLPSVCKTMAKLS